MSSGRDIDGQVLVYHDLLGLETEFKPKFVKRFADLGPAAVAGVEAYVAEVKAGAFPAEEHSFHAPSLRLLQVVPQQPSADDDHAGVVGAPV
jgi:3-methyl-2-oxobutanoate hydroxymethyltransferase